jgi:sulfofructose kinase
MRNHAVDVCGLGQCALDYIGLVDTYPRPDVKCELSYMTVQGGGPVATALVALTRWGIHCAFIGVIGDDSFGAAIRKSLDDEGINTSGVLVRKGFASQFAFILAEPGVGRRTIFWRRPTGPAPDPVEMDYSRIEKARVFHTDGLFTAASLAASKVAKDAGVCVVVDAGSMREGMLELARQSDCFLASETFARSLVETDNPLDACRKMRELGPKVVGVTLGAKGYVALAGGRIIKGRAFEVKAVDTTGCGDVFHAGFIYGLLKNWPVEKSLEFAAWAAAMVSLQLGGRAGIPDIAGWVERS